MLDVSQPKPKPIDVVMTTRRCHDCGEPTRAWSTWPDEWVCCEDCSDTKWPLAISKGPDRARRGIDPGHADQRYDGLW